MPGRHRTRLPVRWLSTSCVYGSSRVLAGFEIEIETLPRRHLEQIWIAEEIDEYVRLSAMISQEIEVEEERQFFEAMHAIGARASHVPYTHSAARVLGRDVALTSAQVLILRE